MRLYELNYDANAYGVARYGGNGEMGVAWIPPSHTHKNTSLHHAYIYRKRKFLGIQ